MKSWSSRNSLSLLLSIAVLSLMTINVARADWEKYALNKLQGYRAYDQGDYYGAIEKLNVAAENLPSNEYPFHGGKIYATLGRALVEIGNYKTGIERLWTGAKYYAKGDHVERADVLISIAHAHAGSGDTAMAYQVFQQGINDYSQTDRWRTADMFKARARFEEARGRFGKAIEDWSRAVQIDKFNTGYNAANSYYWRAIAYQKAGQYSSAIDDCVSAIDKDPKEHHFRLMAECLRANGQEALASRMLTLRDKLGEGIAISAAEVRRILAGE